jgi:hypothetical protein
MGMKIDTRINRTLSPRKQNCRTKASENVLKLYLLNLIYLYLILGQSGMVMCALNCTVLKLT